MQSLVLRRRILLRLQRDYREKRKRVVRENRLENKRMGWGGKGGSKFQSVITALAKSFLPSTWESPGTGEKRVRRRRSSSTTVQVELQAIRPFNVLCGVGQPFIHEFSNVLPYNFTVGWFKPAMLFWPLQGTSKCLSISQSLCLYLYRYWFARSYVEFKNCLRFITFQRSFPALRTIKHKNSISKSLCLGQRFSLPYFRLPQSLLVWIPQIWCPLHKTGGSAVEWDRNNRFTVYSSTYVLVGSNFGRSHRPNA